MIVTTQAISNPNKLLKIEDSWNTLVGKCVQNPFCLTGFVKQFMEFYLTKGWTPLVLVTSANNSLVGIAPLITKKKLGVRFAKFVGNSWFPPDIIVDDKYRETCIAQTLNFLFRTLQCQFVDFTLPAESPNLQIVKQKCKGIGIHFYIKAALRHSIVPIRCSWDEFKASRGRNFRRRFRKIERKLDQAGSWRIICVENEDIGSDTIKKILEVERMSWKEAWRTQIGMKIDPDLPMIWKAAQYTARTQPGFHWSVWFLELNGKTIAYCLIVRYKNVAFDVKTSYHKRYKRFYPGIYVNNAAIRELFKKRLVRNIDFLIDLPFHRIWTSTSLPRVKVLMTRKGVSSIVMHASADLMELLGAISPRPLKRTVEMIRGRN